MLKPLLTLASRVRQRGITLVELMVALVASLILLAGILTFYASFNKGCMELARSMCLEREMRSTLSFMARDIRRAGYWEQAHESIGETDYCAAGFSDCDGNASGRLQVSPSGERIEYAYDQNQDGVAEQFGFYLDGETIYYLYPEGSESGADMISGDAAPRYTELSFDRVTRPVDVDGVDGSLLIHELVITATARVAGEGEEMSRTLSKTVRIRNDEYAQPSP